MARRHLGFAFQFEFDIAEMHASRTEGQNSSKLYFCFTIYYRDKYKFYSRPRIVSKRNAIKCPNR